MISGEQDSRELYGCTGAGIGRQHTDVVGWHLRDQQDAAHRFPTGNTDAADHLQAQTGKLDGGHDADIGRAALQPVGALRGQAEIEIVQPALLSVQHAPHQRDRVEKPHRADA